MTTPIATENFKIELEGKTYDCEMKLLPSGAFQYGNQTCCVVTINDGAPPRLYDTRYEPGCGSAEAFHNWSLKFLQETLNPDCTITRAD